MTYSATGIPLDLYHEVYELLDDAGLGHVQKSIPPNSQGVYNYPSHEYPWAKDLCQAVERVYDLVLRLHNGMKGVKIIHERMMHPLLRFSWEPNDMIFDFIARYGCVFPGRILYLSNKIEFYGEDFWVVPIDFLVLAQWLRPLLTRGLTLLLPWATVDKTFPIGFDRLSSWEHQQRPERILIEGTGYGLDAFVRQLEDKDTKEFSVCRALLSPFLLGSRLEDMAELSVEQYEDFNRYVSAAERFLRARPNDMEAIRDWIGELDSRSQQLRQTIERKAADLKRQGLECALGMGLTITVLLFPAIPPDVKAALLAGFSTKTLYDGFHWLGKRRDLVRQMKPGHLWTLWKAPGI